VRFEDMYDSSDINTFFVNIEPNVYDQFWLDKKIESVR